MKKRFYLLATIMFLEFNIMGILKAQTVNNPKDENLLYVYSSPDLYNLTRKWTSEYMEANPTIKINVIKEMNPFEVTNNVKGIFITDDEMLVIRNQKAFNMIVGRDIIVPVMNKQNPSREMIIHDGITSQYLERVAKNGQKEFVKSYVANDSTVIKGVGKFINSNDLKAKGIETANEEEIIAAVSKEAGAIGFIRLNRVIAQDGQNLPENIEFVPIDKNGNGKIDYMEEIYDNPQSFKRGVWIGKYPKSLSAKIYALSAERPAEEAETSFLNWILNDGQQFLNNFGYSDLVLNERQAQLAKIEPTPTGSPMAGNFLKPIKWIVAILFLSGAIALIWKVVLRFTYRRKDTAFNTHAGQMTVFDEGSTMIPQGLFFDKTHTWAFIKKDGRLKVGIDDFLQHVTGKITRIEMKKIGDKIRKGEHMVTIIQKGKQLDIYSPVSGIIRGKNKSLNENPSLINISPYDEGWIYSIEPKNWPVEIQFLSMADKYRKELKKEFQRLKDFLMSALKANEPELELILQDGGALKDNLLEDLGPEVWDDFQTEFIDSSIC